MRKRNLALAVFCRYALGCVLVMLVWWNPATRAVLGEETDPQVEEVIRRMSQHISLEADVSAWLDFKERVSYVDIGFLSEKYGYEVSLKEMVRQAKQRKSDPLLGDILLMLPEPKLDFLREVAVQGMDSSSEKLRRASLRWCAANQEMLTKEERSKLLSIVVKQFTESGGDYLSELNKIATPAQIPIIRRVYEKEYKDKPQRNPYTGKPMMYCCGARSTGQYMLVILNKLGDPKAS